MLHASQCKLLIWIASLFTQRFCVIWKTFCYCDILCSIIYLIWLQHSGARKICWSLSVLVVTLNYYECVFMLYIYKFMNCDSLHSLFEYAIKRPCSKLLWINHIKIIHLLEFPLLPILGRQFHFFSSLTSAVPNRDVHDCMRW